MCITKERSGNISWVPFIFHKILLHFLSSKFKPCLAMGKKRNEYEEDEEEEEESGPPSKKVARKSSGGGATDDIVICDISEYRRVAVRSWQGRTVVDIREFYLKDGKKLPGKKGISLTIDQWKILRDHMDQIEKAVTENDAN